MKVSLLLDEVEMTLNGYGKKADRAILLRHVNFDLSELCDREQWDWAVEYHDPLLGLSTGVRDYELPENFGDNFIRGAGTAGEDYACKLDNGSVQTILTYKTPAQFYSSDMTAGSNGQPSAYTVTTLPSGRKQLSVDPKPDSSYTYYVDGAYVATDWGTLTDEDDLPPIPGGCAILSNGILRRYIPEVYEARYQASLAALYMAQARQGKMRFVPIAEESKWQGY